MRVAHYLRILYHFHCKLIVWIDQQAPTPEQVVLLLAITQIYIYIYMVIAKRAVHFMVHSILCIQLSHERREQS